MNLQKKFMTRNDCYTAGRTIVPKGIMVHSTATPGVMAADWFSRWNKSYKAGETNRQACVHAFVDDTSVWQYLPWNHRGWHAGGSANNTHIGFEICEPGGFKYGSGSAMIGYDVAKNKAYFDKAYRNAVELCVMLCKMYSLDETDIICHNEGYKKGIASNHGDVMHWFPKHGKNMDTFRADVKKGLNGDVPAPVPKPVVPEFSMYIVKAGDSLNKIEQKYHSVTWQKIAKENGLSAPYIIRIGQVLKVPFDTPAPAPTPTPAPAPAPIVNPLKVGAKIKITSTRYATGQSIPIWVRLKTHTVQQISGDRVLLKEIVSWVYKSDVKVVG